MSKLSECVEILDHKRIPLSNAQREGLAKIFPYYGAQGVIDYVDNYLFDGEYILVAEDGNNLKSLSENIATWATGKFWVNNHAHILGAKEGYSLKFIYYLLNCMDLRGYITGSAQPKFNQENLANVELQLPDINTQNSIAKVLSTIDEKIANNNAICAELEAMAKLLHDYWFVQFDFPDENGKPYKSSGGKMVWSEELKREIPEGWEVKTIGDISRMVNDSITPNKSSMYHHFSIPAFDDTHMPVYEPGASIDSNKYCVNDEYILVSKLNPQFKRIWVISKAPENSICSTEYMPFVSTNDAKEFLYSTLNSDAFYTFMVNSSSSSTGSRKRMPPEMCPRFKIPYPKNGSVVTQYCNAVKPMLDRANSMYSENQELASLRDFLLPLLMNGQVVINSDE